MSIVASSDVYGTLKSVFGFSTFRPLQEEIVEATLAGRDVFVLMPTGGGKSLCYQLPALLQDGLTVVVSPLIALMKDQVDALRALGVAATYINSSLDMDEIGRRQRAVVAGRVKLLYVAPERLMMSSFLHLLTSVPLARFVIDEAHCISEWGHDFRPEYRDLKQLRELFPRVPLGAFTATATARVQADISAQLGLEGAAAFKKGFNRPNLFYEVRPKRKPYESLVQYLRQHRDVSGIIYCFSRKGTESLAEALRYDGFKAAAYHAGLSPEERRKRQEAFSRDDVPIIVATIAFGMGIDKPDVRFVIHYDLPKTLENYYQESGRAGRDGEPSDCILFYTYGDAIKQQRFIAEKESETERKVAEWQLRQMVEWAEATTCRRVALLAYFDEEFEGQEESCCDVCAGGGEADVDTEDATVPAQMFLSCVKRTGERFGAGHVIAVLRGGGDDKIRRLGHDKLSTYGIGKDQSEEWWKHLSRELVRRGYLSQMPENHMALKVTERGRRVLFDGEKVAIAPVRQKRAAAQSAPVETHNFALFDGLRALRKRLADERGVPPYVIFHDAVLRHMAASLPTTQTALRTIPGIGVQKATQYGDIFLGVIAVYVRETGATPAPLPSDPPPPPPTKGGIAPSVRTTIGLFNDGNDIPQICAERGLAPSTVENHIEIGIAAGLIDDIDRLISPQRRLVIDAAMDEVGWDYLGPIREHLGEEYSYGELRIARALRRRALSA